MCVSPSPIDGYPSDSYKALTASSSSISSGSPSKSILFMGGFGTVEFGREEVGHYFPEIFRLSADCRFGNCTHTHEPGCAVLDALAEHRVAEISGK